MLLWHLVELRILVSNLVRHKFDETQTFDLFRFFDDAGLRNTLSTRSSSLFSCFQRTGRTRVARPSGLHRSGMKPSLSCVCTAPSCSVVCTGTVRLSASIIFKLWFLKSIQAHNTQWRRLILMGTCAVRSTRKLDVQNTWMVFNASRVKSKL